MTKKTEAPQMGESTQEPQRKALTVVVTLTTAGELEVESNINPIGCLHLLNEASATLIQELAKTDQPQPDTKEE